LSNQFAALEPAAEWYQDVMLDNFDSDEEASSQADSDSDGSEWEEVPELSSSNNQAQPLMVLIHHHSSSSQCHGNRNNSGSHCPMKIT